MATLPLLRYKTNNADLLQITLKYCPKTDMTERIARVKKRFP